MLRPLPRNFPSQSTSSTTTNFSENDETLKCQLCTIATANNKTRPQILTALRTHFIENVDVYKQSSHMLALVLVMMSEKSDTSIMLYDFSKACNELEKWVPHLACELREHWKLPEPFLLGGIDHYNTITGKELTLNTAGYGLTETVMVEDIVDNFYAHQHMSDQTSLAQTSKFHLMAFQNRCERRLDNKSEQVIDLKKTMTSFRIYSTLPLNRQLPFFLDDEQGLCGLGQLKIDGPRTRQRICDGEFKTVGDARKSREVVLVRIIETWDEIPPQVQAAYKQTVKWQESSVEMQAPLAPYSKPTLESLIGEGYSNPHIKYLGDDAPAIGVPFKIDCKVGRVREQILKSLVIFSPEVQEYIDRGLLSRTKYYELDRTTFFRLCLIFLGFSGVRNYSVTRLDGNMTWRFNLKSDNTYLKCKELIDRGFISLDQTLEMDQRKFEKLIYFFDNYIECDAMNMQQFLDLTPSQMTHWDYCVEQLKLPINEFLDLPESEVEHLARPDICAGTDSL